MLATIASSPLSRSARVWDGSVQSGLLRDGLGSCLVASMVVGVAGGKECGRKGEL